MPTRLESLLELALRTSTANADPFKDDLKYVQLFSHISQLTVDLQMYLNICYTYFNHLDNI